MICFDVDDDDDDDEVGNVNAVDDDEVVNVNAVDDDDDDDDDGSGVDGGVPYDVLTVFSTSNKIKSSFL